MEFKTFKTLIKEIKENSELNRKFYKLGLDLQCVADGYHKTISLLLKCYYGEEGEDWISWFLYERDGNEKKPQAWDKEGNEICYDLKSLWEYIEDLRKSPDFKEYVPPKKMSAEERLKIIQELFSKPVDNEL